MIDSKKLMLALIVLQIATVSLLLLTFFPPESDLPRGNTVAIESSHTGQTQPVPVSALQTELRSMIRAEIEAREAASAAVSRENQSPALSTDELQDREQAITISGSIMRQAISARAWTRADTEALLPHLGRLPAAERRALMDEFHTALNRQELKLEDIPPL
jgi:hypothetical protein